MKVKNMSEVEDINNSNDNKQTHSNAQSEVHLRTKSFSFTWTLNDFPECYAFSDARIYSPEFTFEISNWRLMLSTFSENNQLNAIKLRLVRTSKPGPNHYIKFKFSLLKSDGSLLTKEETANFTGEITWSHRILFQFQEGEIEDISSVVQNGRLTIFCEMQALSCIESDDLVPPPNSANCSRINAAVEQVPKVLLSPYARFFPIKNRRKAERDFFSRETENSPFFLLAIIFAFFLLLKYGPEEMTAKKTLPVNATGINKLIIDSTLKIKHIAEVLNLTDIKIKSTELLTWYHVNYNISISDFPGEKNFSEKIIPDYKLHNVSGIKPLLSKVENDLHKLDDN